MPKFYIQILQFFNELFEVPYKHQILWNNKLIKIANKTIFWREWYEAGVICFLDVMNNNAEFILFEEFKDKFQLRCDRKTFNKFKKAVLRGANKYHLVFGERFTPISLNKIKNTIFKTNRGNYIDITKADCKTYYNEIIAGKIKQPTSFSVWINEYRLNEQTLYDSYIKNKRSCQDTRLLAFQFKIINDIVANNKNLEKWGLLGSPLCEECQVIDTIWHSFSSCPNTVNTLKLLQNLLNIKQFNATEFIFGYIDPALNLLMLVAKLIIWRNRFYNRPFKIEEYIEEVKLQITADANKMNNTAFENKWRHFVYLMEL